MIESISFSKWERVLKGFAVGGQLMLLQAPFLTFFNRISVVSCDRNLPALKAFKAIYLGEISGSREPSARHFFKGMKAHLTKESLRLFFKTFGLLEKPGLDRYFESRAAGKLKSDLLFAVGLSCGEMVINPADTFRTLGQAEKRLRFASTKEKVLHFYKGSTANGLRQFGIWFGFPISERCWSHVLEEMSAVDPHSVEGIALKAVPQAVQTLAPVWILERLKNELQCHQDLKKSHSRYRAAFQHIISNQGWRGLMRGFVPKVGSISVAMMAADYLMERGRKSEH